MRPFKKVFVYTVFMLLISFSNTTKADILKCNGVVEQKGRYDSNSVANGWEVKQFIRHVDNSIILFSFNNCIVLLDSGSY